jgi:hypothetical protein
LFAAEARPEPLCKVERLEAEANRVPFDGGPSLASNRPLLVFKPGAKRRHRIVCRHPADFSDAYLDLEGIIPIDLSIGCLAFAPRHFARRLRHQSGGVSRLENSLVLAPTPAGASIQTATAQTATTVATVKIAIARNMAAISVVPNLFLSPRSSQSRMTHWPGSTTGAGRVGANFDMNRKGLCELVDSQTQSPHMPLNKKLLVALNNKGVMMLGDSTLWRIAPGLVATAAKWTLGTKIAVEGNAHIYWKHKLINTDTGEGVLAVPSLKAF